MFLGQLESLMEVNQKNAMGDSGYWAGVSQRAAAAYDSLKNFGSIPTRADGIAEQEFPNSARDASTKNAFRHALGTGMMTQALGGGQLGGALAKGAGYLWEGLGAKDFIDNRPGYREDTKHDLNANSVGATVGQQTINQQELINALRGLAANAPLQQAPGIFAPSPGYLTRSVQ
jgi:hypothetical protein